VGHREGDFDIGLHLSQIFPSVTSILIFFWTGEPEALLHIHTQVVQKLGKHIKIGASFYPNDAPGVNIDVKLLDHHACKILPRSLETVLPLTENTHSRIWINAFDAAIKK
jgi:hypothetical protein